jgi:hypothetical protein
MQTRGCAYSDALPVCLDVRFAGQSVFGKVLLGSCQVNDRILQGLLVSVPFFPCAFECMLRLCEGRSRLLEFLFNILQSLLKGFLLGLRRTGEWYLRQTREWGIYTHEAASCASVVDLYSSYVAFNDANASSLA